MSDNAVDPASQDRFIFNPDPEISGKDLARLAIILWKLWAGCKVDGEVDIDRSILETIPADLQCHFRAQDA